MASALANQFDAASRRALVQAQARHAQIAKEQHAEVMRREPQPTGFTRIVDGRRGVTEESVKAGGVIIYIYERSQIGFERDIRATIVRLDEIAQFALATLRSISPVGSGRDRHPGLYRDSHKLFRNGYPVDDLSGWKDGDEISISNFVDYSRILEVGDGKFRLPLNVYERAADVVGEKFGKDAKIEFTWRGIVASIQVAQNPSRRRGFGARNAGSTRQHNASQKRFPTLVITPHVQQK